MEKYNTVSEDLVGEGFQDVEDTNKNETEFKKYLRIFLMRNRMEIHDLEKMIQQV